MFLKYRYRLGYESLCAEVSDPVSWRRFWRIPLDAKVPHPTTLMKLTIRCGSAAVAGLNEALPAKAAGQKLLRTAQLRADTTMPANVFIRRIPGCWPGRSGGSPQEQEVLDLIRIGVLTDREIDRPSTSPRQRPQLTCSASFTRPSSTTAAISCCSRLSNPPPRFPPGRALQHLVKALMAADLGRLPTEWPECDIQKARLDGATRALSVVLEGVAAVF